MESDKIEFGKEKKERKRIDRKGTLEAINEIRAQLPLWKEIFTLAALTHDLGHGPFSHTFENLNYIKNIFNGYKFKKTSLSSEVQFIIENASYKYEHEDLTLIYIDQIYQHFMNSSEIKTQILDEPLSSIYLAALVHKKFRRNLLERNSEISNLNKNIIRILSTFISGMVDCDRMDYIARDSYYSGIPYGNVAKDRLIRSVRPLIITSFDRKEIDVALAMKSKNVHMLDHFLFCLYQMYTQLYLHPGCQRVTHEFQEVLKREGNIKNLDWKKHSMLGDWDFIRLYSDTVQENLDSIRNRDFNKDTKSSYVSYNENTPKVSKKWVQIENHPRELLKDKSKVILFERKPDSEEMSTFCWSQCSCVANELEKKLHEFKLYWNRENFEKKLKHPSNKIDKKFLGK